MNNNNTNTTTFPGCFKLDESELVIKVPQVRIVDREPHYHLIPLCMKAHPGIFAVIDGDACIGWWSADRFSF